MLEGLRTLGRTVLDWRSKDTHAPEEALLQTLVKVDEATRYEGLVHFHLRPHGQGAWRLVEPTLQDVDAEALYRALWVGHAPRNVVQARATVASLEYLISQVLPALAGMLDPGLPDSHLQAALEAAVRATFLELPVAKKSEQRYRWVWNLPALGWFRWNWVPRGRQRELEALGYPGAHAETPEAVLAYAQQYGVKKTVQLLADTLAAGLAEILGHRGARYLFTLHVDGRWLAREPAYHRYLYAYYLGGLFTNARLGRCHVCGQEAPVTEDTTRLWLKFYITDKPGFASGFRKTNFRRNYTLCQECYRELLAGEAFLRTRLRSWLGTTVYVLPVFYLPQVQPSAANLTQWAGYVVRRWEASRTLDGWRTFHEQLADYQEYENQKAWFLLDFLFVDGDGRSIKLQHYIQDVPPPRLDALDDARHRTRTFAQRYFYDGAMWDLSFQTLYYLFPIQIKRLLSRKIKIVRLQPFYQFLGSLLHERPVDFHGLISLFLETASVHYFQKYGAYVHKAPPKNDAKSVLRALCTFLVQSQLLRYDLMLLGLFSPSGGRLMSDLDFADEIRGLVPNVVWEYMDALSLNVAQRALFLLGYLMGEVAQSQHQAGSVTVLNKIHFQGMDDGKIRRLSNEILDQMRIYRVLRPDTRDMFAAMRSLMDQAGRLLSPAENTYWVLSGYAFRHLRRFGGASEQSEKSPTE